MMIGLPKSLHRMVVQCVGHVVRATLKRYIVLARYSLVVMLLLYTVVHTCSRSIAHRIILLLHRMYTSLITELHMTIRGTV